VNVPAGNYTVSIPAGWGSQLLTGTANSIPKYYAEPASKTVYLDPGSVILTSEAGLVAVDFSSAFAPEIAILVSGPQDGAGVIENADANGQVATVTSTSDPSLPAATCTLTDGVNSDASGNNGIPARCPLNVPAGNYSLSIPAQWSDSLSPAHLIYAEPASQPAYLDPGSVILTSEAGLVAVDFSSAFTPLTSVASGSTNSSTPASATDGPLSSTASGGTGTVTVGQYNGDPEGAPSFDSSGQYIDVYISPGNTFTSLTITICDQGVGTSLQWWDPQANSDSGGWEPVLGDPGPTLTGGCLSVTLDNLSSPTLSQLIGTVFGFAVSQRARVVPGSPSGVTATAGDAQASVAWTPPSISGSSSITSYNVRYSSNGGTTWSAATTSAVGTSDSLTGLTNGTGYVFEVAAVNAAGTGPYSALSAAVTPSTTPGAPSAVTATSNSGGRSEVTWLAPTSNGGVPITSYVVRYSSNGGTTWSTATSLAIGSSDIVTGLTNGTSYVFEVAAVNAAGTGPYSPLSAAVTPVGAAVVKLLSKTIALAKTAKVLPVRISCRNASCVGTLTVSARVTVKIKRGKTPGARVETVTFGSARFRLGRDSASSVSIHLSAASERFLEGDTDRTKILASVLTSGNVDKQQTYIGKVTLIK
jgi:hypothetical protein